MNNPATLCDERFTTRRIRPSISQWHPGLAVFGAMVIGLYVLRKRGTPQGRGFLQVSVGTPEEKHVSNMQINGYLNPTYAYFETDAK